MHRASAVALATAAIVVTHAGCATPGEPRRQRLPAPPSEVLRAQLGTVQLATGLPPPSLVFTGPARGPGEGAARGAGLGAGGTIVAGAEVGGWGLVAGLLLAPVAALVGAIVGAAGAEPATTVERQATAVAAALEELRVPQILNDCVADRLRESPPAGRPGSADGASTILEVTVEQVGLRGPPRITPPLTFILTERTRLIRASDGTELYGHWLTYQGRSRPLEAWLAEDGALLREEVGRACRQLAERIVDEVFFLYLPGGERSGRR
jgi:hypothetical protein